MSPSSHYKSWTALHCFGPGLLVRFAALLLAWPGSLVLIMFQNNEQPEHGFSVLVAGLRLVEWRGQFSHLTLRRAVLTKKKCFPPPWPSLCIRQPHHHVGPRPRPCQQRWGDSNTPTCPRPFTLRRDAINSRGFPNERLSQRFDRLNLQFSCLTM